MCPSDVTSTLLAPWQAQSGPSEVVVASLTLDEMHEKSSRGRRKRGGRQKFSLLHSEQVHTSASQLPSVSVKAPSDYCHTNTCHPQFKLEPQTWCCCRRGGGHDHRLPAALCNWQGWVVGRLHPVVCAVPAGQLPLQLLCPGQAHLRGACVDPACGARMHAYDCSAGQRIDHGPRDQG